MEKMEVDWGSFLEPGQVKWPLEGLQKRDGTLDWLSSLEVAA